MSYEVVLKLGGVPAEMDRLQALKTGDGFLFPQEVRLTSVFLVVNGAGGWARLDYQFFGRKADGTEHKRRTNNVRYLPVGKTGRSWLGHLAPELPYKHRTAIEALWPEGEQPEWPTR